MPEVYNGYRDVDTKCHDITLVSKGKTIGELPQIYEIEYSKVSKSIAERIIVKMFGGESKKLNQIEMFASFGLIGKTIVLTTAGTRTEDMKLFRIYFDEWTDENIEFEDSQAYDYFANHQFLCMFFEDSSGKSSLIENKFLGFKRLSFDDAFLEKDSQRKAFLHG